MTTPAEVAALVRAIRRAYDGVQYGGVETFVVRNIHSFAERLAKEGVYVDESRPEAA